MTQDRHCQSCAHYLNAGYCKHPALVALNAPPYRYEPTEPNGGCASHQTPEQLEAAQGPLRREQQKRRDRERARMYAAKRRDELTAATNNPAA